MYRSPVVVHLSDLHFGPWNHDPAASAALAEAVIDLAVPPDFIVVTGDLTQFGRRCEMKRARAYLEDLLAELWRIRRHRARCIVVPGNHDVFPATWLPLAWIRRKRAWNKIFPGWSFVAPGQQATTDITPFDLTPWLTATFGLQPEGAQALALAARCQCEYFPQFRLAFVKIDSNAATYALPWAVACGAVGGAQLGRLDEILEWYDQAAPSRGEAEGFADARRIALVHHHVVHLPRARNESSMLLRDAGDLRDRLGRHRVDLVLHGHRHRASQVGLVHWSETDDESRTAVLAAGSATARDIDDGHHSYHVIRFRHLQTQVWRPKRANGNFEPMGVTAPYVFRRRFEALPDAGVPDRFWLDALEASLRAAEEHADMTHVYTSVSCTAFVDGDFNYWGRYILEGTNATRSETGEIPFHVTAVGAQSGKSFGLRAVDLDKDEELSIASNRPPRLPIFPFGISLPKPLLPGQSFRVKIEFCLRGVMLQEADYDLINLLRFPRGVQGLSYALLASGKIIEPRLLALGVRRIHSVGHVLRPVTEAAPWEKGEMAKGYGVEIKNPSAIAYLLSYARLDL